MAASHAAPGVGGVQASDRSAAVGHDQASARGRLTIPVVGPYIRLLAELKTLQGATPLHQRALAELARAQGVVLGNVGVFVDASVDPETLLHSRAAWPERLPAEHS